MKLEQFLGLQQGTRSILEYTNEFDHLAQYAPEHVNTESRKRDCYLRGLNARMQEKLSTCTFADYSSAVSTAITAEEKMRILDETLKKEESLKRKNISFGTFGNTPQRMKVVYRCPPPRIGLLFSRGHFSPGMSELLLILLALEVRHLLDFAALLLWGIHRFVLTVGSRDTLLGIAVFPKLGETRI